MAPEGPVRLAIAGLGGYAREITNLILINGGQISPEARVVAVCDPAVAKHAERAAELQAKGIRVFDSYEQMLAAGAGGQIEGVWLPVPIPFHLPLAEQAMRAGIAVMVEKPAAGCLDEVDRMIALRDRHRLPFLVGFQDVYDRTTLPLKRRILAGEFGRIEDTTLYACWPRSDQYFGRASWAGRIRVGDAWVLDSPANNALAHFVNIALFLLGPNEEDTATIDRIEVELYRAAPIENYDTISTRAHLRGGQRVLILLTHACAESIHPVITFHGDRGRIVRTPQRITTTVGERTEVIERSDRMRTDMLERFARAIRGIEDRDAVSATLDVAREHTRLMSAASEFAPIHDVPPGAIRGITQPEGGHIKAIAGIEEAFAACAERRQLLHESGLLPFTSPAVSADLQDYTHFAGPHAYATHAARTA